MRPSLHILIYIILVGIFWLGLRLHLKGRRERKGRVEGTGCGVMAFAVLIWPLVYLWSLL